MNFLEIWPILAFLTVQTVGITWWAATVSQRLKQAELELASRTSLGLGERMTKIEVTMISIDEKMGEIKEVIKARRRT